MDIHAYIHISYHVSLSNLLFSPSEFTASLSNHQFRFFLGRQTGLLKRWDASNPVHLLGHSFGGNTAVPWWNWQFCAPWTVVKSMNHLLEVYYTPQAQSHKFIWSAFHSFHSSVPDCHHHCFQNLHKKTHEVCDESFEVALYNMIAEDHWGFGTGQLDIWWDEVDDLTGVETIIHTYYIFVYYNNNYH